MNRRRTLALALVLLAVGIAVRANNALRFPVLGGYDAYGHFTYIWYLTETGRVPLSTSGWSFFHPPLYYWVMSEIWQALPGVDAVMRLKTGTLLMSLLGMTQAAVAFLLARRVLPGKPPLWLAAAALVLFVPVNIYGAAFLGGEGLSGVLCAIALLLIVRALENRSWQAAFALGVTLGLAMLAKFTALALVVTACAAIALKSFVARDLRWGARTLAVSMAAMFVVCGWYYQRNVVLYGTPFKLSRDVFLVSHVEDSQPRFERDWVDYVTFDPLIFVRPVWPRGFGAAGDAGTEPLPARLRNSVWTGLYANAWFDGFGGWVLPTVTDSNGARRAGQLLLTLATIPTLIVLAGLLLACRRTLEKRWDDTLGPALIAFFCMVALYVISTRTVPIPAAGKATYFMPVASCFGLWFALGVDALQKWRPAIFRLASGACAALAAISLCVFWQGFLFRASEIQRHIPFHNAARINAYGVVHYAGGDGAKALSLFERSANLDWHVGHENLALMSLSDGRAADGLVELETAEELLAAPGQTFGRPDDRSRFENTTRAEYANLRAVLLWSLGSHDAAGRSAARSLDLDASIPESHFNLGVVALAAGADAGGVRPDTGEIRASLRHFDRALALDSAFAEAWDMRGVAHGMEGDCGTAREAFLAADRQRREGRRVYPVETGPGIEFAASIGRRKTVSPLPEELQPSTWRARCGDQSEGS